MLAETKTVAVKSLPPSPDLLTPFFSQIWFDRTQKLKNVGIDLSITVLPCPYFLEELAQLEKEGKRVGYLPEEFATQEGRYLLGIIWSGMRSYSTEKENMVTNKKVGSGWFDYEAFIDVPNTYTTQEELSGLFASQNREGMNLNEYIVASQDSKLLTGHFLDENGTWARLLESLYGLDVLNVQFDPFGFMDVFWNARPTDKSSSLGGRSVGRAKKSLLLK